MFAGNRALVARLDAVLVFFVSHRRIRVEFDLPDPAGK
jgi:hypothetical protein